MQRSRPAGSLPRISLVGIVLAWLPCAAWAFPQNPQDPRPPQDRPRDVTEIDLDDLIKVRVTSPSRKEQLLTEVPAAIYVLREDDLKRSGATSLAEALRAVPGVQVARPRSNSWAVSARGFNSTSANKLLVLIDGRSVYSPLHSGVFWDAQDTFLEDVDRIEVIRGPGGSLWGANAVNGVINIITKRAGETQGGVVTAGAGTEERIFGGARYGFQAAEDLYVRIYAKYFDRDDAADGIDHDRSAVDGWFQGRGGFRADYKAGDHDRLTFSGDFYEGQVRSRVTEPSLTAPFARTFKDRTELRGGNVMARWDREFDPTSNLSLQVYYDYYLRSSELFTDSLHTGDLDFQHRFRLMEGHDLNWGLGYRLYRSALKNTFTISADPSTHTDDILSAFVQDEITLVQDRLRFVVGSKFEHNDYTGFEIQPSARLAWNPADRHMAWLAASRSVRTPSIIDVDLRLNAQVFPPTPTVLTVFGDEDFRSEEVLAHEAGYRIRPVDALSLDLAVFYNRYNHLRSIETGATFSETDPQPTHDVRPLILENEMRAQTWGVELAANLQLAAWWLLQVNYTYLRMNLNPTGDSNDTTSEAAERQSPRHQVWARSAMDLPWDLTLDVMGRYVSGLKAYEVDPYVEMDVRLAWRDSSRRFEAAVVGQNVVHESHPELNTAAQRSEMERGVYVSLTWRF
jgi:iron complex outermembrane recepter protein